LILNNQAEEREAQVSDLNKQTAGHKAEISSLDHDILERCRKVKELETQAATGSKPALNTNQQQTTIGESKATQTLSDPFVDRAALNSAVEDALSGRVKPMLTDLRSGMLDDIKKLLNERGVGQAQQDETPSPASHKTTTTLKASPGGDLRQTSSKSPEKKRRKVSLMPGDILDRIRKNIRIASRATSRRFSSVFNRRKPSAKVSSAPDTGQIAVEKRPYSALQDSPIKTPATGTSDGPIQRQPSPDLTRITWEGFSVSDDSAKPPKTATEPKKPAQRDLSNPWALKPPQFGSINANISHTQTDLDSSRQQQTASLRPVTRAEQRPAPQDLKVLET
jgi:hypothetical protein